MTKPLSLPLFCAPSPDRDDALAVQIYRDLLAAIRAGRLDRGARLPSSRAAAAELGVARSTVNTAYDLLRAEGAVEIRRGAAPVVAAGPTARAECPSGIALRLSSRGTALAVNPRIGAAGGAHSLMSPGEPSEDLFPADEWGRTLRRVARRRHGSWSAYADPHGLSELRRILAERLAADRGLSVDPGRIVITTGTQGSLSLAAQLLTEPGDVAAMEDPGYLGARAAFLAAGLRLAPLPVDGDGARSDAMPEAARAIYLTPSNQYPMGVRLSRTRRMAILAHAQRTGAAILEDDYDSEFLWRGREIAALAAEAPEGPVVFMGSASKVLIPALRLGWMVVPGALVDPVRAAQRTLGTVANLHAQAALAETMRTGRYRAQLGRIARVYEARGRALAEALSELPGVSVRPPDGGVQVAVQLERPEDEDAALSALAARGFGPGRLSAYALEGGPPGLIVGFADATSERTEQFVNILRDVLRGSARQMPPA